MPFGFKRRGGAASRAGERPAGVSRGEWQQHLRDPSVPLTDPVPGLPEYARSAGWAPTEAESQLDASAAEFVHDMVQKLHRISSLPDPNISVGGGPNRYADSFGGQIDGRDFVVANVSYTVGHFHGGERPVAGSVCAVRLGFLLPLVLVTPRGWEHTRALTKPVKLGRADFDKRFAARSGHVDYAVELLTPMADEMLRRDDWAFFLEFANLISIAAEPFRAADEVKDRIAAMSRLVSLIPPSVRDAHQVKVPAVAPGAVEISPEDQRRARQLVDAMPADQRRALIARMRSEGPERVIRELLDAQAGSSSSGAGD